jgi:PAS domain S-box-containing protein
MLELVAGTGIQMLVDVIHHDEQISAASVLTTILSEFNAITEYRILQESLPRRLAGLLKCRCVLFYQHTANTLQFVAGSFDNAPGWSSALLSFAHINPVDLKSDLPEACAWRERHVIAVPSASPTLIAAPLIYRRRGVGVLVAIRNKEGERHNHPAYWTVDEVNVLEAVAGVVALLLEDTRLLERDRERIHELSLLNSISSQMNCSMYELSRVHTIVVQRAKEISAVDLCELIDATEKPDTAPWITPMLRVMLFQYFRERRSFSPLIIERPGSALHPFVQDYLAQLPTQIKTFFAIPLLNGRRIGWHGRSLLGGSLKTTCEATKEPEVLGVIVGGYYHAWKLRRTEIALLQVLASQTSAAMENISLMAEVVEARNEARKLLRQVLDDQRLKALILESIPSGLVTVDLAGNVLTFNRAAATILGYHPYEVIGQPLHKYLAIKMSALSCAEGLSQSDRARLRHAQEGQRRTLITENRHGRKVVLDVDLLPLCDDLDTQIGSLVTFTDVTSVHHLEEEKRRLDRLASLGEMAANVAHEVRNPLASIKTSMQMLMDDLTDEEKPSPSVRSRCESFDWVLESIAVVLKEVERLDCIVRDLLLFAKPRQLRRVECDVVQLSDRVLQFIHPQCVEAGVAVHRVYAEIPLIRVDDGQIEQVMLNLCMNALQAMPDGGALTVSCRLLSDACSTADPSCETSPGTTQGTYSTAVHCDRCLGKPASQQWLELSVSDTGSGIPPEQLEQIFQPFFTTKAHGIGLGLAITRRLVEDHGGYICAESQSGYGATLSVRLPVIAEAMDYMEDDGQL